MRAIDEESSRPHRRQALLALLDPILIREWRDDDVMPDQAAEKICIGFAVVKRFHNRLGTERVLDDEHGLRRRRRQLEQSRDVARQLLRQSHGCFPKGRRRHALPTKPSMTRLEPAFSKSTSSLLPSTATMRP